MSKAKEILEKLKDKVFMTEKGLGSFAPIISEAIAELEAPVSCKKCKFYATDKNYPKIATCKKQWKCQLGCGYKNHFCLKESD